MTSIFDFLREVERRPSMFVGWPDQEREKQLLSLDFVLMGYLYALHQHKIQERALDFRSDLGAFVRAKHGWSMPSGPIGAVLREIPDANKAWNYFWFLVWEFEKYLNERPN
ncbi:hypothetical protein ACN469_40380 [Corallococcus terminator]